MKHLSETGLHAGRRLCLAKDGESIHAMYAPLQNPDFRATVCPACLGIWAYEAYDDGDDMPEYIVKARKIDAILSNDEVSSDDEIVAYFVSEIGLTEEQAKSQVARRTSMLNQNPRIPQRK